MLAVQGKVLTGVGVTCKEMLLFDCMDRFIHRIWNLPGFFIFIYDQSRIIIRYVLNPYLL